MFSPRALAPDSGDDANMMTNTNDERRQRVRQAIDAVADKSQSAIAEEAGVHESTLRNFLLGATRDMRIENYEALSKVLGVSPEFLIFGFERYEIPDADILAECLVAVVELATGIKVVGNIRDIQDLISRAYQIAASDREDATSAGVRMAVRTLLRSNTSPRNGS